jgi:2-iminoacetate synthase ThiH
LSLVVHQVQVWEAVELEVIEHLDQLRQVQQEVQQFQLLTELNIQLRLEQEVLEHQERPLVVIMVTTQFFQL